ncbi:MAG: hypothetical protein AAGF11_49130 [Myxococcota bacterium]
MLEPTRLLPILAAAPLLTLGACVISPEEGNVALGNPNASLFFEGFASAPNATIELQILNKATSQWETFATTTSSALVFTFGGQDMYSWNIDTPVMDTSDPAHLCRLTPSCSLQESTVFVRFEEIDGDFSPLMTFDDGGVQCTVNEVNNGADLLTAAWTCRGTIWDQIAIPVIL